MTSYVFFNNSLFLRAQLSYEKPVWKQISMYNLLTNALPETKYWWNPEWYLEIPTIYFKNMYFQTSCYSINHESLEFQCDFQGSQRLQKWFRRYSAVMTSYYFMSHHVETVFANGNAFETLWKSTYFCTKINTRMVSDF